jgi:hypothetical protein
MAFKDKYTTDILLKAEPDKEKDKVIVSPDAFAQGDMMQVLIDKLEHLRLGKK